MVVAITLTEKIPFEANAWKSVKLPAVPCITEIDLRVILKVSTGGNGGTPSAHAPVSIVKNINVSKGGDYPIQAEGWLLFVKNYYEYGGKIKKDALPTGANATATVEFELIIHPGYHVKRKDDDTVALRADDKDTYLNILWGSANDLGSGYSVDASASYAEVTVWYRNDTLPQRTPAWEVTTKSIDRTYSDLEFELTLPEGKKIPKVILEILDSGGADSDNVVSEIGLIDKRGVRKVLHKVSYFAQVYDDKRRYLVDPLTGHVIFDAGELGLAYLVGTKYVVLGMTTRATGSVKALLPAHL